MITVWQRVARNNIHHSNGLAALYPTSLVDFFSLNTPLYIYISFAYSKLIDVLWSSLKEPISDCRETVRTQSTTVALCKRNDTYHWRQRETCTHDEKSRVRCGQSVNSHWYHTSLISRLSCSIWSLGAWLMNDLSSKKVSLVPRPSITANSVEGLVKLLSSSSALAVIEGLGMRLQKGQIWWQQNRVHNEM